MWKNKVKKKENSARICFSWFDWDQHGEGVRPVMAAGNFILLQMGVKYFLSHPQPQVLYDKSYQKSFYKICIYLWRNGDRMDFYVIIVVTPVQYVISEDISNVSKLHSVYTVHVHWPAEVHARGGVPEQRRHKPRPRAGVIHAGVRGVPEVGPR